MLFESRKINNFNSFFFHGLTDSYLLRIRFPVSNILPRLYRLYRLYIDYIGIVSCHSASPN